MRAGRLVLALVALIAVGVAGFLAWAWEPEIGAIEPPSPARFEATRIRHGAELAALGDCQGCHTAPGGAPYAGGVAIATTFGTIYGSNITPDPDAGIGGWSAAAFRRAMQRGVDRVGRHLYPAFPYDHFTGLTDQDIDALYAFLMTRQPAPMRTPPDKLVFPLNVRLSVAAWKLLFFRPGRPPPIPAATPERGTYLVETLAHCGACHTPHNILQAEKRGSALAGGRQEGWDAPALDVTSPAPVHWTADSLFTYLRTGSDPLHGVAAGPMQTVVENLRPASDDDVRAMAASIAAAMGRPSPDREAADAALAARVATSEAGRTASAAAQAEEPADTEAPDGGAMLYAGACAGCHTGGVQSFGGRPLELQTGLSLASPRNLIQVILNGIMPVEGRAGPMMPAFCDTLKDKQIADLVRYLRQRFGRGPAWSDVDATVAAIRAGG